MLGPLAWASSFSGYLPDFNIACHSRHRLTTAGGFLAWAIHCPHQPRDTACAAAGDAVLYSPALTLPASGFGIRAWPPHPCPTPGQIFFAILYGDLDFRRPPWDEISELARDFVAHLLEVGWVV